MSCPRYLSVCTHRDNVIVAVSLEQTQIRVRKVPTLREANVEEVLVGLQFKGALHVEEDLFVGPVDQPVQLDGPTLVQIGAVQFIIRDLWGLKACPLVQEEWVPFVSRSKASWVVSRLMIQWD